MKRRLAALLCALLLLPLLSACGDTTTQPPASSQTPPEEPAPLRMEVLKVEFAAAGSPETLMAGAARLPDKLRQALAEAGVEVERVQVTLGASPAATMQALAGGGVDVALLSAQGYVQAGSGGAVLLADAVGTEADLPGETAQICAAPTNYGSSLARRTSTGATLTWEEVSRARWGVLPADSELGSRYVSLWLADAYEGNTLADLPSVRRYDSYEELLRAAAQGEVDVFPCTAAALEDWSAVWEMDATRSDEAGRRGFGRTEPLTQEVLSLGETERRLALLTVAREDELLNSPAFAQALCTALNRLTADDDFSALTGCTGFAPLGELTLDGEKRLLTLEGVTQ